jgi:signal transduction histidine kinase
VTRRIAIALMLLTAAILVAAVVPLALGAIAHERDAYVQDTARTARSIAILAEARLQNDGTDPELSQALLSAAREHDELLVLNQDGQIVASQGVPQDAWNKLAAEAGEQDSPTTELTKNTVIAVATVWGNGELDSTPIGTVVLERPTGPLNQNIANLWLYLIALSCGAMAAAMLVAIYFARWVSRPLARLDTAARRIADGDLTVRARGGYGPPELRRMAATFNMMAGRLEALVHGHRAMVADASHQLRTPLTALRLRLDLLAVDSAPAAAAELAGAQEEIARLSRLVDGLLATARAEAMTEQLENIDVLATVNERVAAWQPVADGHDVKLVVEDGVGADGGSNGGGPGGDGPGGDGPGGDGPGGGGPGGGGPGGGGPDGASGSLRVALGAGHLEQVLDNLIDNAIDAIGTRGGSLRIRAEASDAGIVLTVADDGPGMTLQERSRAFLRYTTGSQNGTGLGLAIVHRLITANGGTIRLADTPGGGLTVVLEFPRPAEI